MSFPNIPDITPDINITFEDAINLLLTSIALEEISLSELMDAETKKILFVLNECKHKDTAVKDAIDINKSVDQTIKNMIKLQMLLQFKLENVTELIPTTTTTTTTTTSTTTTTTTTRTTTTRTTTTHTTTCTTSTCSTTTKEKCRCGCGVIGKGVGKVSNEFDEFYCQTANLQAFIFSSDFKNRYLRYSIKNDDDTISMVSIPTSITIECPSHMNPDNAVIHGKGHIEKKSKCNSIIVETVNFVLNVWDRMIGKSGFEMLITSKDKKELVHDSGFVHTKKSDLGLRIE